MKFLKKNKFTIIVIVCFVLLVLAGVKAKELFFPNVGKAIYGDRLLGIENVKITDQKFEQILSSMKENSLITSITYDVHGKLVNFQMTIIDEASVADAKSLAPLVMGNFEEEQKAYYDFQLFIKKDDEAKANFPIIGYKHKNRTDFTWTKDRAETVE